MEDRPSAESASDLLIRLQPGIRRVFSHFRIDAQDREDLLQEALLAWCVHWDEIETKDAWFFGTLRNLCRGWWRRRRIADSRSGGGDVDLDEIPMARRPQLEGEYRLDLRAIGGVLPARTRMLLWLRFGTGLSSTEAAVCLGYHPASARKAIARSLGRLRECLGEGPASPV